MLAAVCVCVPRIPSAGIDLATVQVEAGSRRNVAMSRVSAAGSSMNGACPLCSKTARRLPRMPARSSWAQGMGVWGSCRPTATSVGALTSPRRLW